MRQTPRTITQPASTLWESKRWIGCGSGMILPSRPHPGLSPRPSTPSRRGQKHNREVSEPPTLNLNPVAARNPELGWVAFASPASPCGVPLFAPPSRLLPRIGPYRLSRSFSLFVCLLWTLCLSLMAVCLYPPFSVPPHPPSLVSSNLPVPASLSVYLRTYPPPLLPLQLSLL